MSVPLKGHCHTTTSTFFPATAKHKACLRSCHRKRPISREQVPFLFSKTIPMACRAVSCSLGSFHHLKHLAALQHAAAARWEPTVPLLSWATQSWAIPVISLATRKKKKKTHPPASLANARHPIFRETIDYIIFNCTILSTWAVYVWSLRYLNDEFLDPPFQVQWLQFQIRKQYSSISDVTAAKCSFSSIAVAISQWNKDPFCIPWETWPEWLMLC